MTHIDCNTFSDSYNANRIKFKIVIFFSIGKWFFIAFLFVPCISRAFENRCLVQIAIFEPELNDC